MIKCPTGILRFKTEQSVDRALEKFRTEEIVVQDVAVHVKVLKSGTLSEVDDSGDVNAINGSNP